MYRSQRIRGRAAKKPPIEAAQADLHREPALHDDANVPPAAPATALSRMEWNDPRWMAGKTGELLRGLPAQAMSELASFATPFACERNTILFTEGEQPCAILFLFEGRVKLSMNSSDGRRLIRAIAGPDEILGLTSAVSGHPYDVTAETQEPCVMASVLRQSFLDFLLSYPVACHNLAIQLSLECRRTCDQLRTLGLAWTAPAKLARLLLEWCGDGRQTKRGIRFICPLTHEEIAEHIGVSRETVSRSLHEFRNRKLVEQRGSAVFVSNLRGLEIYAGAVALPTSI
jgi:CRP/FNR family transcriptional regulator, cyclic AMP receptor protein